MHPVVWIFGIPGSGKTTIAQKVAVRLATTKHPSMVLDADEMRQGLCSGLGYESDDRLENVRRIAEVAKIVSGVCPVVCCAVTPERRMRAKVREILDPAQLTMVCLVCSPAEGERRGKPMWKDSHFDQPHPSENLLVMSSQDSPELIVSELMDHIG